MPTTITQLEDAERRKTVLRIEGSMLKDDAILLEKVAREIQAESGKKVAIDLSDLHFLDSESAPVLRRMEKEGGIEIEGVLVFLQKVLEENER